MSNIKLDPLPDAELAAIRRGALFVLVGFVSSVVARLVFHGAAYSLDAGAVSGAPGMRPPEAADPDFMLLLPLLAVLLIAKLIEAFGKIVCTSRPGSSQPPRLSTLPIHLSLACDLIAVIGIVLRLFNFGRTAGPIVSWLVICDLVGFAALLPFDLFTLRLARPLGLPSIAFWSRVNMVAATLLLVAGMRPEWWFSSRSIFGPEGWKVAAVLWLVVALAAIGSFAVTLIKILGHKLAAPPPTGST